VVLILFVRYVCMYTRYIVNQKVVITIGIVWPTMLIAMLIGFPMVTSGFESFGTNKSDFDEDTKVNVRTLSQFIRAYCIVVLTLLEKSHNLKMSFVTEPPPPRMGQGQRSSLASFPSEKDVDFTSKSKTFIEENWPYFVDDHYFQEYYPLGVLYGNWTFHERKKVDKEFEDCPTEEEIMGDAYHIFILLNNDHQ